MARNYVTGGFRSPANGTRFTKQLFIDMLQNASDHKKIEGVARYTLHQDLEGYVNFRREYVLDMDKTGYKTANRLLENYDHWLLLMKRPWFKEAKEIWDAEIDAKLESEAQDVLRNILKDDEAKKSEKIAAAKTLLGRVAKRDTSPKRGRPTAEEIRGNLKQMTEEEKTLHDDRARIGLAVVNGDGS